MVLDNTIVSLISIQFRLSNPDLVPAWATPLGPKTASEQTTAARVPGRRAVDSTPEVSLSQLISDLEMAGYHLVESVAQERERHWITRFNFGQTKPEEKLAEATQKAKENLITLVNDALWAVEVWINPFSQDGEVVSGKSALSINLAKRTPFVGGDGRQITRRKPGTDQATPIEAQSELRLVENVLDFVSTKEPQLVGGGITN